MIMYLVRDIPAFVMYCINGESGSSLLIESTDSMIYEGKYICGIYMKEEIAREKQALEAHILQEIVIL